MSSLSESLSLIITSDKSPALVYWNSFSHDHSMFIVVNALCAMCGVCCVYDQFHNQEFPWAGPEDL